MCLVATPTLAQTSAISNTISKHAGLADLQLAAVDADTNWSNPFGFAGVNGVVNATVIGPDSNLYVGGAFTMAGDTSASYVAMWDGTSWHPLGTGLNGTVLSMAIDTNGDILAGGWFTGLGDGTLLSGNARIARWDGATWSTVADGLTHDVQAIAVDTVANCIYEVGGAVFSFLGELPLNRSCKGASWEAVGVGLDGLQTLYTLALDQTFSPPRIYIGGDFDMIDDSLTANIAVGIGQPMVFHPLGSGVNDRVLSVELLGYEGGNDTLWVGGDFSLAGDSSSPNVSAWVPDPQPSKGSWVEAGLEFPFGSVKDINRGIDGQVWIAGDFIVGNSAPYGGLARRSGAGWARDEANIRVEARTLSMGFDSTLYFGGNIHALVGSGGQPFIGATGLGSFKDGALKNLRALSFMITYAIAKDSLGGIYVGGSFKQETGSMFNHIAYWDGASWDDMNGGVDSTVYMIDIDENGLVTVGGDFLNAGGAAAPFLATWNGSSWSTPYPAPNATVRAMVDGLGDTLYFGGQFDLLGGVSAPGGVGGWDGSAWFGLSGGPPLAIGQPFIEELAHDSSGTLYAGRYWFGIDNGIFRWDDGSWFTMPAGPRGDAMVVDASGRLIAGDQWLDGSSWRRLESGISVDVTDQFIDSSGVLYAALANSVTFSSTRCYESGLTLNGVALFDGSCWHPLGTGVSGLAQVIADGSVLVGGGLSALGDGSEFDHWSSGLGLWSGTAALAPFSVRPRLILQGAHSSGDSMDNVLNDAAILHLTALPHPYKGLPWQHPGIESVTIPVLDGPGEEIVDWVYFELLSGNPPGPLTKIGSKVGLVLTDGTVVGGYDPASFVADSTINFGHDVPGTYRVAAFHRNHLAVLSTPLAYSTAAASPHIDFTDTTNVFGLSPMADLGGGYFALFAGDANIDGQITASDFNLWLVATKAGANGYLVEDLNMDGQVTAADFNIWLVNTKAGAASEVGF